MKRRATCISIFYNDSELPGHDGTYNVYVERDDRVDDERGYEGVSHATLSRLETLVYRNRTTVNITQGTPAIFIRSD